MAFYQEIRFCVVPNPALLGDGICHNFGNYNSAGCGFDRGDCDDFNVKYPGCMAEFPSLLTNSLCDGGAYNTQECGWDNKACTNLALGNYPNCTVENAFLLGNGKCDDKYNTTECGFDGGDCLNYMAIGAYKNANVSMHGCGLNGGNCVDEVRNEWILGGVSVDGIFMSVDHYKRISRTYAGIQTTFSLISLISSIAILSIIWRSFKKLSVPFHRFLFGLSIADIISSAALMFATLPSPNKDDAIWHAMGNRNTCRAQGFFIFFGSISAPLYNCSICIYRLITVTYKNGRNADIYVEGNIEFIMHAIPTVVPLLGTIVILSLDAFHPNMTYCFIGADPAGNENMEQSDRSDHTAKVLFAIFAAGPYMILPFVITITMVIMYRAVLDLENRREKLCKDLVRIRKLRKKKNQQAQENNEMRDNNTTLNEESSERATEGTYIVKVTSNFAKIFTSPIIGVPAKKTTNIQRRCIVKKARSYSLAFFATYLFPMIISFRTFRGLSCSHALNILARIFFPLQGFFNFAVFIYPKMKYARSTANHDGSPISWSQAFLKAIQSRGRHLSSRFLDLSSDGAMQREVPSCCKSTIAFYSYQYVGSFIGWLDEKIKTWWYGPDTTRRPSKQQVHPSCDLDLDDDESSASVPTSCFSTSNAVDFESQFVLAESPEECAPNNKYSGARMS